MFFMKKKNKKKDSFKVAEQNLKILKSGKLKVQKGQKISLDPFINDSVQNVVCSRIDGILSKENIVIDGSECRVDVNCNLLSVKRTVELLNRGNKNENKVYTVAHIIRKSECEDTFDFIDDTIIGSLLRTTTLASIYKKIKSSWLELNNDDKTSFTNILFIPKIYVFLDDNTGRIRKVPFMINLLLVAMPSSKYMVNGVEKIPVEECIDKVVTDTLESSIKCGCKDLILSPYCNKLFLEDEHFTGEIWYDKVSTQRVIENIVSINFCVNDEDLYVIFGKNKK